MIVFTLATFATAIFAVFGVRGAQAAQTRRQQRAIEEVDRQQQEERGRQEQAQATQRAMERKRRNPYDVVTLRSTAMTEELTYANTRLDRAVRELGEAKAALEVTPKPLHSGVKLHLRVAVLGLLTLVTLLGFALAIETFVALNGGSFGDGAPLLKGLVAGSLELLVAFAIAHHLNEPRKTEWRWQLGLALLGAVLVTLVVGLATYSDRKIAFGVGCGWVRRPGAASRG